MALKLRKDIKKSSYYVWFLGAKESKGLRGSEYILPVIKHLEEREKDVEPFKVTLQVSHKGLKIIQHIVSQGPKNNKPKNETIKHFIPHNTITCVYQHDDIIACILLLFNPVTKCPLHVHAYRCDSVDTATLLKQQLQILIERPENQKKFSEIEARLKPQKELKKVESSIGSDTGTSTRESESSEERFTIETSRVTTLYDSVAAELRAKFGKKNSPILLPPRDYDTVHRQKGNLTGIELRRCLNANIVGQNVKGRRIESSGGSSGIGSDHPPSPESPDTPDSRFNTLDNHSTSDDEDWNGDPAETSVYLMEGNHHVTLPRPSKNYENARDKSPEPVQRSSRYSYDDVKNKTDESLDYRKANNITKYLEKPIAKFSSNKYLERQKSLEKEREQKIQRQKSFAEFSSRAKTLEKNFNSSNSDKTYREKIDRYPEDRYQENRREKNEKPVKYFEDDGFDENMRYREKPKQRYSYEEDEFFEEKRPVPKARSKYASEEKYFGKEDTRESRTKFSAEDPRFYTNEKEKSPHKSLPRDYDRDYDSRREDHLHHSRNYFEETTTVNRRNPMLRQRSPSPDDIKAPKDRFKDAKEKFMLMEKERLEQERRRPEPPISPVRREKQTVFVKRNGSSAFNVKDQINKRSSYDDRFYNDHRDRPKPAPRHIPEEHRYRDRDAERYRNTDKYDPKRRSMFSLIEEEHRKNSNEIAKELKRRSYLETSHHSYDDDIDYRSSDREREIRDRHFQDLPESDRYHTPLSDGYSKSSVELDRVGELRYESKFSKNPQKLTRSNAGYRHSYAEPKLRLEKSGKKHFSDLLHRTNSTVSNSNGRVGIASVHPY